MTKKDKDKDPGRALGTGAKEAIDGDPSKPALRDAEDVSPDATIPGVTVVEPDAVKDTTDKRSNG